MWESIFTIVLGSGSLLLLLLVLYKVVVKKKKVQGMHAPYDDMTRGTDDVNGSRIPPIDTRQIISQEESEEIR